jgi:hypothetical protein
MLFIVTIEIITFSFSTEEIDIEVDSVEVESADETMLVETLHEQYDKHTEFISQALGHYDVQLAIN